MTIRVESHPLFARLEAMRLVQKKSFWGRITPDKARRFRDMQLDEANGVLRRYGLGNHHDLVAATYERNGAARKRLLADAEASGAPLEEVERALRTFSDMSFDAPESGVMSLDAPDAPQIAAVTNAAPVMPLDIQEIFANFCRGYEVSEANFQAYFLTKDAYEIDDEEIALELDCPIKVVRLMRSLLDDWHTENSGQHAYEGAGSSAPSPEAEHVATIRPTLEGWTVEMAKRRDIYTVSRHVEEHLSADERVQWRQLESEMRALNERTNRREQAIRFICRRQRAFLVSGDPDDLAPLSQGEIATAIGCGRDRVHRLLFDDDRKDTSKAHRKTSDEYKPAGPPLFLLTPRGRVYLRDLLRELDEVAPRLKRLHPKYSDAQLSLLLMERFGVYRTRAAVQAARQRGAAMNSDE